MPNSTLRPGALAFVAALAIAHADTGRAQTRTTTAPEPEISIISPQEWKFRDTLVVKDQQPLRIVGLVRHPEGVQQILINDKSVRFGQDRENASFSRFDTTLAPSAITDVVTLTVISRRGTSFKRIYNTTSSIPGPDSPRLIAAKPAQEIPRTVERKDAEPAKQAPIMPACSWAGYKKRGIGYGVVGGVGIVIGASGQKAGFGLAAVAAVVAGIDGLVSANRSECKSR